MKPVAWLGAGSLLFILLAWLASPGRAQAPPVPGTPSVLAEGQAVFARECKVCHGARGDGQGLGAHLLDPRPRNLTAGVFKLRTTPSGELPTDQDLFRTITHGIPNSMMPSFQELSEAERWALVAVVKELAGIGQASQAVPIPVEPVATPARVAKGQQVYAALKCAECHGASGRGDGPNALTLKSDDGRRIRATDLTRGVFKGGGETRDLYLRISEGIDGTPMPAYGTSASPDEIWALVHYLQSLHPKPTATR